MKSPVNKLLRKPGFTYFVLEKPTASQDIVSKICHQNKSSVFFIFNNDSDKKYSGQLGIHTLINSLTF